MSRGHSLVFSILTTFCKTSWALDLSYSISWHHAAHFVQLPSQSFWWLRFPRRERGRRTTWWMHFGSFGEVGNCFSQPLLNSPKKSSRECKIAAHKTLTGLWCSTYSSIRKSFRLDSTDYTALFVPGEADVLCIWGCDEKLKIIPRMNLFIPNCLESLDCKLWAACATDWCIPTDIVNRSQTFSLNSSNIRSHKYFDSL